MHIQDAFAAREPAEVEALLTGAPFACLVTHDAEGLFATHMPLLYDAERGLLTGHMARSNPHVSRASGGEGMVIFQGANAYISPNWYPSKARHGRVAPTWNFEVAHVYGRLVWRDDPAWLRAHLDALVGRFEAPFDPPWARPKPPMEFVETLIGAIVGLEFAIERIEAKRKLSQHRPEEERLSVIAGLTARGAMLDAPLAQAMRATITEP
jgi:transcriptional regulator